MMSLFEAVEEVADELFPPKPGGLVDRHRKREAEKRAAEDEAANAAEPVEQLAYKAVKVAAQSPENFNPITYVIAAGTAVAILPLNKFRYRATVLLITAASTVVLARDNGNAISQAGFILPTGIPLPLVARGQLYAFNPTGASVQVSVISEVYAPEPAP
jgi:hypothetical protein